MCLSAPQQSGFSLFKTENARLNLQKNQFQVGTLVVWLAITINSFHFFPSQKLIVWFHLSIWRLDRVF